MPLSSVVGAQSIVKPGVCTSTTKPASPFDGQMIYMTDVDQSAVWDGSAWVGLDPSRDRNAIINGAMTIDQRYNGAVASNIGAAITLDRWFVFSTAVGLQFSSQQSTDAPVGFKNSLLLTVTGTAAQPAAGDQNGLGQKIEGHNAARFLFGTANAKTVTISFWVKSSVAGVYGVGIRNSDVTRSRVEQYTISSPNTWEYKTVTIPGCPDGTWLTNNGIGFDVQWDLGTGSTYQQSAGTWTSGNKYALTGGTKLLANSGATWRISGVQFEAGAVATPFEFEDYGTTFAKCQRYYETGYDTLGYIVTSSIAGYYMGSVKFAVEKRATPTMTTSFFNNSGTQALTPIWQTQSFRTGTWGATGYYNYTSGTFLSDTGWIANAEL